VAALFVLASTWLAGSDDLDELAIGLAVAAMVVSLVRYVAAGRSNWRAMRIRSVGASSIGPRRIVPFSLRTPQRNRNEWGETTVNKTWRKPPAQRE
jgi:hypothetical protein